MVRRSAPRRGALLDAVAVRGDQGELGRDENRAGQDQEADGEQAECGIDWSLRWADGIDPNLPTAPTRPSHRARTTPAGCRHRRHRRPDGTGGRRLPVLAAAEMIRQTNHMGLEPSSPAPITTDAARALARLAKSAELALGGVDLSLPQYRVLVFLSEHDAAAASALLA